MFQPFIFLSRLSDMCLLLGLMLAGGAFAACPDEGAVCDDELESFLQAKVQLIQTNEEEPSIVTTFSVSGDCSLVDNGACVTSKNYPDNYTHGELCTINAPSLPLQVVAFNTEEDFDNMTVNGIIYDGSTGPQGIIATGPIKWETDNPEEYKISRSGWKICVSQDDVSSAAGDPHLVNLRGEHFDLNVAGDHLLLQIPKGSGKLLEVSGHVEHLPTEVLGQSCDQFLFKTFSVRGAWVDAPGGEITIDAGKELNLAGFAARRTRRGTSTATPYTHLMTRKPPAVVGNAYMWGCRSDQSYDKRTLCRKLSAVVGAGHRQLKFFDHKNAMMVMSLVGFDAKPVHLAFSRFEGASPSYVNFAFDGLQHTDDIGGLLGSDDHREVAQEVKPCNTIHHAKPRPDARRLAEAHHKDAQAKRNHK